MKLISKINRYHIIIIGVILCAAVVAFFTFMPIKQVKAQIAVKDSDISKDTNIWNGYQNAQNDLKTAQDNLAAEQHLLNVYMNTRMPEISLTDRIHAMITYWQERSEIMGPMVTKFLMTRPGVDLVSGITIAPASTNPNDIPGDLITVPLGDNIQVSVKSFRHAIKLIRELKKCPRLVSLTGVQIAGPPSPDLTVNLKMVAYIFPTGKSDAIATAAPSDGSAAGGSPMVGGGMPGGMPGGSPGGSPGGMPGGSPGGMPGGSPGGMPGGQP